MKVMDGQKGKRADEAGYLEFTHKRCPGCNRTKAVRLFYRKKTKTRRGWAWDSKCIECRRGDCAAYGKDNRERRNARLRSWRRKNPGATRARDQRARIKSKYGLTLAEVEAMRAAQDGSCAICKRTTIKLLIDHCHTTGRVRGLLCQTCNTFLGWYEKKADQILAFQRYLAT